MEREKYLTTGEMAHLAHVTKNTLFHYEKMGLFAPEIVMENDYRYYSIHQLEVLDAIILLRDLGMPLIEIRAFLEGRNPEKLLELFDREEEQIKEQMRRLKDQSQWIKEKREKIHNVLSVETDQIYVRHQTDTYVVISSFDQPTDKVYAEKITELTEAYARNNSSMQYEIGYMQQTADIRQGIYDNYLNVVLALKHKPKGMTYACMPEGEYLITYQKGHWSGLKAAYKRMMEYAGEKGLTLGEQFLEVYAVDGLMAEQEEDYITEIRVRIEDGKNA